MALETIFTAPAVCDRMGYTVVETDAVDRAPDRPCELRRIGDAAGLDSVALNWYAADPGEQIPLAYHYHDEQEEAFYVLAGTLHVETPDRTHEVPEGGLFAVEPGSPHRAFNPTDAEDELRVLALGAPADVDDGHAYER